MRISDWSSDVCSSDLAGRSVDSHDDLADHWFLPSLTTVLPNEAYRPEPAAAPLLFADGPVPIAQRVRQMTGSRLLDDQLHLAHWATGVVVDVDVLDVDTDLPGICEQPGQLARVVRDGDEDRLRRPGRATVLAGNRAGAGDSLGQELTQGSA